MTQEPLVSVIIPCYNREKFIADCIRSVIEQDYKNLEIIVVNDGSSDGSRAIIDQFEQSDNRIVFINKPQNEGLVLARRSGAFVATGKYIQHLDADDALLEGAIRRLVDRAEETNADVVAAPFYFCHPDRSEQSAKLQFDELSGVEYFREILEGKAYWSVWSNFRKRELEIAPSVVFFPDISVVEDAIMMSQLILDANKVAALHTPILNYNKHDAAMTAQIDGSKYDQIRRAQSWMERYFEERGVIDLLGYGLAKRHIQIAFWALYLHQSQIIESEMDRAVDYLDQYPLLRATLSSKEKRVLSLHRISPKLVHLALLHHKIKAKINGGVADGIRII